MKCNTPKSYLRLPPSEKKIIEDLLREQEEKDCRIILGLYMKMICYTLHKTFGFGEYRLNLLLASHKRLFREQSSLCMEGTQLHWIADEMKKIFRKNGFPQEMMDKMIGEVELVETGEVL
jgi:hypothetical protein